MVAGALATPRCALAPTATPALALDDGFMSAAAIEMFHFMPASVRTAASTCSLLLFVS